jgi:hypothetical protein
MRPPPPATSILSNLISPEARGPVGTVAQEETNKTTPPIKTDISMNLTIPNLLSAPFGLFLNLSNFSTFVYKLLFELPFSSSFPPGLDEKTYFLVMFCYRPT